MRTLLYRLLAAGAVLLALGATAAQAQNYDPNAVINMATNADPTFNPWYPGVGIESDLINSVIFEGLTRWDGNALPSPALATKWSVSPDGLTWTFDLRPNVKWQDGKPFTADDVAYTFNDIVLNNKLGANLANIYTPVDHVEVVNPLEVKFILKSPFSSLPSYLAYYEGILPKHIFQGVANPFKLPSFNKAHPIGTGPFMVQSYVSGAYVRLVRNPNYWGGTPKLAGMVFKIVPEPDAQVAQVLSGGLDLIRVDNPALLSRLQNAPGLSLDQQSENVYFFVILHQTDPRFQDVRVRQALLYAIDRNAIIKSVLKGYGEVATGPIAPVQKAYYDPTVKQYPYDPAEAKKLLAEAGWTPGPDGTLQKDGKPFEITIDEGQFGQLVPIALLVQQYWQDIGVKVKMNIMDWNSYLTKTYVKRDYQATVCWWRTPTTPDVSPYYLSSAAASGNNWPGYKDPHLDQLLETELAATSQEAKVAATKAVEQYVAQQLPYLYLYYPKTVVVRKSNLKGLLAINLPAAFQHTVDWYVSK
ncbi:MAG: ABC transporter substrate-binding protein [Deinococcales bacterium]